ncbi:MAG: hypothetical protein HYV03_05745 [Deltaproteobacteria bacterium]|nr:hypothetical protein [Deltaproteobacteria bacterium]
MKAIARLLPALLCCVLSPRLGHAVDFAAHGYYRLRGSALQDLDTQRPSTLANTNDRFGLIQYNQMRLRVEPTLKVNDFLSLHTQFDILDNLTFGSQATKQLEVLSPVVGTITLPAGAGSLSVVGSEAGENRSLNVRRAWIDIFTPIGKLRAGRQPSHWGLGIFQNDGNHRQGDFGDTADRVMFLTQQAIGTDGALTVGALWDIAFEAQRDPRIGGLGTAIRDNGQDTNQYALVAFYEEPRFAVGAYGGLRRRDGSTGTTTTATDINGVTQAAGIDGDTLMYFLDAYGRVKIDPHHKVAFEYVRLGGKISTGVALNAIPFTGLAAPGIIQLPAKQDLAVNLAAVEAEGTYDWGGEWKLQGGFAEGDATPLSQRITQFGFRPDYNLGLLLFHHPLGTSPTLRNGTTGATLTGGVPITGNFINNAFYGGATYLHRLDIRRAIRSANEFKVGGRVITAWAHKPPVSLNFAEILGNANMPSIESRGKWYGVEFDLVAEARFFDHLFTSLEAGYLWPGSAYNIDVGLIDPGSIVATMPYDKANPAYGGRLTLSLEF